LVTIKKSYQYIDTFAMLGGNMYTCVVVAIFGIERGVKVPYKVHSEEIQRMSTGMLLPRQTMQRGVMLQSCKKTDVGSSVVQSINCFHRGSFYSNAVMDGTPSVTVWFVDKEGR
jgi:hypothetical protein